MHSYSHLSPPESQRPLKKLHFHQVTVGDIDLAGRKWTPVCRNDTRWAAMKHWWCLLVTEHQPTLLLLRLVDGVSPEASVRRTKAWGGDSGVRAGEPRSWMDLYPTRRYMIWFFLCRCGRICMLVQDYKSRCTGEHVIQPRLVYWLSDWSYGLGPLHTVSMVERTQQLLRPNKSVFTQFTSVTLQPPPLHPTLQQLPDGRYPTPPPTRTCQSESRNCQLKKQQNTRTHALAKLKQTPNKPSSPQQHQRCSFTEKLKLHFHTKACGCLELLASFLPSDWDGSCGWTDWSRSNGRRIFSA